MIFYRPISDKQAPFYIKPADKHEDFWDWLWSTILLTPPAIFRIEMGDLPKLLTISSEEGFMGEVFLSYNHKDKDFVQELYRRLSRDGVDCFFDKESIAWGANWVVSLEKGLDNSEQIVLVLTPEFCKSDWTELERTSEMADDSKGLKRKMRPLMLKPCGDLIPRFLKPIQHINISTPHKLRLAK